MLVYIHQKISLKFFILERYFFPIYPAAILCTYLVAFLVSLLLLCLSQIDH